MKVPIPFQSIVLDEEKSYVIAFAQWWNYKDGGLTISPPSLEKEKSNGCSCQSVGKRNNDNHIELILGFIFIGLFTIRRRARINSFPFKIIVAIIPILLLSGCPEPEKRYFKSPYVVKIDFLKDGECNFPIFYYIKSEYTSSIGGVYILHGVQGEEQGTLSTWPTQGYSTWVGPDIVSYNKNSCSFIYEHYQKENGDLMESGITNYNKNLIPLTIRFKNTITSEEFHMQGEYPVYDISTIPVCRKVLDGWQGDEYAYVNECIQEIPSSVTPTWTPGPDFDWCQLPEYRSIPGTCE